jgi:hypothetical protein
MATLTTDSKAGITKHVLMSNCTAA